LSGVQDLGLRILEFVDRQDALRGKQQTIIERVKIAMITAGQLSPADAFPDLFDADEVVEATGGADLDAALADPEVGVDYTGVRWESPGEAEYDRLMAMMQMNSTITTRDTPGTTEGVKTEPIPQGPDDPEWI
jgi:hypothetical protein